MTYKDKYNFSETTASVQFFGNKYEYLFQYPKFFVYLRDYM